MQYFLLFFLCIISNVPIENNFTAHHGTSPATVSNEAITCEAPSTVFSSGTSLLSDSCIGTYLRVLGEPNVSELTHAILVTPDGNLLIGGNKGNASLLMLVSPDGDVLWSEIFDFTPGFDFIFEMILDSDGMLVASGRDELNTVCNSYYFKYNLQTHSIIWAKNFQNSYSRLETILEKTPGGNYFLLGMVDDNNMFMEVDRNSGTILAMKPYDFGQTDFYLTGKIHNGSIYTAGVQRNGGFDAIRASFTKLSFSGDQLWTRFYFHDLTSIARTYFYENLIENDTIVAFGRGDFNGDSFNDGELILMKSNLDGDLHWAKRYNIPGSNTEFSGSFIPLPDGYILQGTHTLDANGEKEYFILRVNKRGDLIWAKTIEKIGSDWGEYAAYLDGFVYFVGHSELIDPSGDVLFGKISLDGELVGPDCSFASDLVVEVNNVTQNYDGQHSLTPATNTYTSTNWGGAPINAPMDTTSMPGCECNEVVEVVETCANGLPLNSTPDAFMQASSGSCSGGAMSVNITICNNDSIALPSLTPVSFYDGDPTNTNVNWLNSSLLPTAVQPGSCMDFSAQIQLPTNTEIFVVVNDYGSPTPFNLQTGLADTIVQECDFTNNMASFTVSYTPPLLGLGPDISDCNFAAAILDAGPGFSVYQWSNGGQGQTITATQPGTYAVTTTDQCGNTQTDEVVISIPDFPMVDIGYDSVQVCVGENFSFSLEGDFVNYQWSPPSLVDCPTCPDVTVTIPNDTCFLVQAMTSDGCPSADYICIEVATDTAFIYQSREVCTGGSFVFFGDTLSLPGVYQNINPNGNCVDVTTLTLSFFDAILVDFLVKPVCPDVYNGELTAIPSGGASPYSFDWSADTLSGAQLTDLRPGSYFVTVSDAVGCVGMDSVVLDFATRPMVTAVAEPVSCFGVNDGTVTFEHDDPSLKFLLLNSTPTTQNVFDSLWSGGYQYFVLDTLGCSWVQLFTIDAPEKVTVSLPASIEKSLCDSVRLLATVSPTGTTLAWTPPQHLSCSDCLTPYANPFNNTVYTLTAADSNGCSAMDSILVKVADDSGVYLPNAFSPNDDNINDFFHVFSHCATEVRLFRIFDRWGNQVFEASNTPPNDPLYGWDGSFKGKLMDPAVFAYYLEIVLIDGRVLALEGDVSLLR